MIRLGGQSIFTYVLAFCLVALGVYGFVTGQVFFMGRSGAGEYQGPFSYLISVSFILFGISSLIKEYGKNKSSLQKIYLALDILGLIFLVFFFMLIES